MKGESHHRWAWMPGDRVFDVADPRHIGHIRTITHNPADGSPPYCSIRWEKDQSMSYRHALSNLRRANPKDVT